MKFRTIIGSIAIVSIMGTNCYAAKLAVSPKPSVAAAVSAAKIPALMSNAVVSSALGYIEANAGAIEASESSELIKELLASMEALAASDTTDTNIGADRDSVLTALANTATALARSAFDKGASFAKNAELVKVHVQEGKDSKLIDDDGKRLDTDQVLKLATFFEKYNEAREKDATISHEDAAKTAHTEAKIGGTLQEFLEGCQLQLSVPARRG